MLIKRIISAIKRRKKEKEQAKAFEEMLSCVQNMYTYPFHRHDLMPQLRKATDEEVAKLIQDSRDIQKSTPGSGYYIPSIRNYVTHSLEKWRDRIYVFEHIYPPVNQEQKEDEAPHSQWCSHLPSQYLDKDLIVFYYNSFGFPETHLCAREGYVFYDPIKMDIVACAWRCIS